MIPVYKEDSVFVNKNIPTLFDMASALEFNPVEFFFCDGVNCALLDVSNNVIIPVYASLNPKGKDSTRDQIEKISKWIDKIVKNSNKDAIFLVDFASPKVLYELTQKRVFTYKGMYHTAPKTTISIATTKNGSLVKTWNEHVNLPCALYCKELEKELIRTDSYAYNDAMKILNATLGLDVGTNFLSSTNIYGKIEPKEFSNYKVEKFTTLVENVFANSTKVSTPTVVVNEQDEVWGEDWEKFYTGRRG